MSSQITTNHYLYIPAPVYYSHYVVGKSILDTEDKKKGTDENTILDFIRECNKEKEKSLKETTEELDIPPIPEDD